ncbi:MAG TPA: protein phosphatase 2C domain-containing protein [Acidimicrobiales bacterium]|nr:protein phosphatase 2C domain-containing protein [Acidimicrobiales bacterium]
MIAVRAAGTTHTGCVRRTNQDRYRSDAPVFVVADGMGGHAGGERASELALGGFDRFNGASVVEPESVLLALRETNAEIVRQARLQPALAGMGSTVAGLALVRVDGLVALAAVNVGDSRVYRWRRTAFEQISTDHSVVAELIAAGQLAPEQSSLHPERHVVTRALGIGADVEVDSWVLGPVAGDRFLVCSDGLTNELSDADIAALLSAHPSPPAAVEALVERALERGAKDNVTAHVVEVVPNEVQVATR